MGPKPGEPSLALAVAATNKPGEPARTLYAAEPFMQQSEIGFSCDCESLFKMVQNEQAIDIYRWRKQLAKKAELERK